MQFHSAIRALYHAERVGGGGRVVDDQTGFCSLAGCLFIFIGPASVISHGMPLEQSRIIKSRIVHQYEHRFPFYIQSPLLIPVILRPYDPETFTPALTLLPSTDA